MLISVTAPRSGMGQSVTAINIMAMITKLINNKGLIIDTNKYSQDISYYLSDSLLTKGLDDFKNIMSSNVVNESRAFYSCTKNVNEKIDIMASNESQEINSYDVSNLVKCSENYYSITLVDTVSGNNNKSRYFLQQSDVIIVVLNQDQSSISKMIEEQVYESYKEKIVFVTNKYISKHNGRKVKYSLDKISKVLKKAGFKDNQIFRLDFEVELMNECNDNTILNYVFNNFNSDKEYITEIKEVTKYILKNFGDVNLEELNINTTNTKGKKVATLNFLNFFKEEGI